jgi:maltose-binding protein MalE
VHDKLLTSFVGGTAADIIHDEAADIAGFTQQGYLANLTPLIPKSLKASIPQGRLGDDRTSAARSPASRR